MYDIYNIRYYIISLDLPRSLRPGDHSINFIVVDLGLNVDT